MRKGGRATFYALNQTAGGGISPFFDFPSPEMGKWETENRERLGNEKMNIVISPFPNFSIYFPFFNLFHFHFLLCPFFGHLGKRGNLQKLEESPPRLLAYRAQNSGIFLAHFVSFSWFWETGPRLRASSPHVSFYRKCVNV